MTGEQGGNGPVPVRDLMKRRVSPPEAEAGPLWEGTEHEFDRGEETWIARAAGAGAYGTGVRGRARLVAVHFFRADHPETPVSEVLVTAGRFAHLREEELRTLLERATPIELDKD